MIQRAVPHHFEVLGVVSGRFTCIFKGMCKTHTFYGRLSYTLNNRQGINSKAVENCRYHIDSVGVLASNLSSGLYPSGPVDKKGVADTASVGLSFPAAEGRVPGPGPAPGIVVEGLRAPQLIQGYKVLLKRFRHIVEK